MIKGLLFIMTLFSDDGGKLERTASPIFSEAGLEIGFDFLGITIWKCQRCKHSWRGNKTTKGRMPKECPKCKVLNWQVRIQE